MISTAAAPAVIRPGASGLTTRPLGPGDQAEVVAMHERCSMASRRLRYFSAKPKLPQRLFDVFCDRSRGLSLAVDDESGRVIALGHMMYDGASGAAELAFLVEDAWQNRGIGRRLTELLVELGRAEGLAELRASVFSENARMRKLLTALGGRTRRTEDPAVLEIVLDLRGAEAAAA
ncbi:acetyltransferase (GNAT) family protein [Actinocorallia herbida]|uniref:Acetyltransferase (GNAT) family protein n=1 Tax=Actinocorallia herbida TaxID=58109 RepID=A0A3N1CS61_9ACTN|nr:GNAT family N-acetyltransferase [Actinocorallia herbida]ROO84151.1 acetyltransferase (GNAT) family protein [Actinocorallia herbida]